MALRDNGKMNWLSIRRLGFVVLTLLAGFLPAAADDSQSYEAIGFAPSGSVTEFLLLDGRQAYWFLSEPLPDATVGSLLAVDLETGRVRPHWIDPVWQDEPGVLATDGHLVALAVYGEQEVYVIDPASRSVVRTVRVPHAGAVIVSLAVHGDELVVVGSTYDRDGEDFLCHASGDAAPRCSERSLGLHVADPDFAPLPCDWVRECCFIWDHDRGFVEIALANWKVRPFQVSGMACDHILLRDYSEAIDALFLTCLRKRDVYDVAISVSTGAQIWRPYRDSIGIAAARRDELLFVENRPSPEEWLPGTTQLLRLTDGALQELRADSGLEEGEEGRGQQDE